MREVLQDGFDRVPARACQKQGCMSFLSASTLTAEETEEVRDEGKLTTTQTKSVLRRYSMVRPA